MLGDKIKGEEAERLGMIYKALPAGRCEEEAQALVLRLAGMPTKGLGLMKRTFNASPGNDFDVQMELETELQIMASEAGD